MGFPICIYYTGHKWHEAAIDVYIKNVHVHVYTYLLSDSRYGCGGLERMLQDRCVDQLQLTIVCEHQDV